MPSSLKANTPSDIKKAIIDNLAKIISSTKIFYQELKIMKQTVINNGFPNYTVHDQIKNKIKNVSQQNRRGNIPLNKQIFIQHFYRNWRHCNCNLDENISITLIQRNILLSYPNKKKNLYYDKFKTTNMINNNNFTPSIGVLQKADDKYQFRCPLENLISENNNIYVGLTLTIISRWLSMHLSDTNSIVQHLRKHSYPTTEFTKSFYRKHEILYEQNNKQKLQILEAVYIRSKHAKLIWINF